MIKQKDGAETSHKSRLKEELLKIGIKTDEDLREAMRKLPPLQIGIMTATITTKQRKGGIYG